MKRKHLVAAVVILALLAIAVPLGLQALGDPDDPPEEIHTIRAGPMPAGYPTRPGAAFGDGQLALDGVDDYTDSPDQAELDPVTAAASDGAQAQATTSLTLEAWVNFTTFQSADIIHKWNSYQLYTRLKGGLEPARYCLGIRLLFGGYSSSSTQSCWTSFAPGWHHVAAQYDQAAGQVSLFMDGRRLGLPMTLGQVALNSNADPLRVGDMLAGYVDEARISSVIRYPSATYTVPTADFVCDADTRALWHFSEPDGATVFHDPCGADNILTGHNGAHGGTVPNTATPTRTATGTPYTPTATPTGPTPTRTRTPTVTRTFTKYPTCTPTKTPSATPTITPTATRTYTRRPTNTKGPTPTRVSGTQKLVWLPIVQNQQWVYATPTVTPTPGPSIGRWAGTTSRGQAMSFKTQMGSLQWKDFRLKTDYVVPAACGGGTGTFDNTISILGDIVDNQFDYTTVTYKFHGQFTSPTTATGTYEYTEHEVTSLRFGPPYVCYTYLTQSGTWAATYQGPAVAGDE